MAIRVPVTAWTFLNVVIQQQGGQGFPSHTVRFYDPFKPISEAGHRIKKLSDFHVVPLYSPAGHCRFLLPRSAILRYQSFHCQSVISL
ncbi:hypothetical protein ACUXIL_003365 [Ralstonia pickettii]